MTRRLAPLLLWAGPALAAWSCWSWWRYAGSPVYRLPEGAGPDWAWMVPGAYLVEILLLLLLAALLALGVPGRRRPVSTPWPWIGAAVTAALVGGWYYQELPAVAALLTLVGAVLTHRWPVSWRALLHLGSGAVLQLLAMMALSIVW